MKKIVIKDDLLYKKNIRKKKIPFVPFINDDETDTFHYAGFNNEDIIPAVQEVIAMFNMKYVDRKNAIRRIREIVGSGFL